MIISSVLHHWPKNLVSQVMVSGFDLFQNPSFVFVIFSTALEVSTALEPRPNIVSAECNVEHAEDNVMNHRCKVILLERLLTLLWKRIKRHSQFIHGSSSVPDFVWLG